MYKLTRPSGFDFRTSTINYRAAMGTTIRVTDYDPPEKGPCGKGLHASRNPNDCFVGAEIPCAVFKVKGVQPIAKDRRKTRYQALKVLEEIHDLDALFGWKYSEVIDPIHPLKIKPPEIKEEHVRLLKEWALALDSVSNSGWDSVWASVWNSAKDLVGTPVWDSIVASVRDSVATSVRASVWNSVGASVWDSVWVYMSSFFPNVKKWKYVDHAPGVNPFQSGVDLWKMGLVPSCDGTIWRLHGGPDGGVLWQGKL